jgi:ABC-2 type transport system permease protein
MTTDLLVARAALRDAFQPRRLVIAALLVLLPPLVALLWRGLSHGHFVADDVYDRVVVEFVFGFTLTILSVVYGTGVVSQELEQRTIVYLLTRTLPRWRIMFAKIVVNILVVAAITLLSTILLALTVYGPSHFADAEIGLDLRALLIGAVAYGCLFLLAGAVLNRPLIYSLLFVFGWETLLSPVLPGSFARLSIMSYLRVIASRAIVDPTQPDTSSPGGFLANLSHPPDIDISNHQAWLILTIVSVVALGAALWAFSVREYVPREEAE